MQKVKYLVIGAGISGLSFANFKKNDDYLVLEQENIIGGLCKSFYDKDYVWDVAGHFFHYHSEETKKFYNELMAEVPQRKVEKCAKVYYNKNFMDAPFQYNIDQLDKNEFIECLTDLYFASKNDSYSSFEDFVKKTYGEGIANKFLIPYNEKLYACKMNELEKESMGDFLPKLNFESLMNYYRGIKNRTYNDSFLYPINGCSEIINKIAKRLDENRIRCNEKVIKVDLINKNVITTKNTYNYEYLINTMPLNSFLNVCDVLSNDVLNYNKVLVFNIGFNGESIDKKVNWIYFPNNEIFYRVGFYNNIAGTNKMSIYVEISYKANEIIDIDNAFVQTLKDLKKVGLIDKQKVVAYNSYIINPGYVHITRKSSEFKNKIFADYEKQNVYFIGRYARWEYSAMDDSIEQAVKLSKKIL